MNEQRYNWNEERKKIIQSGGTFKEYCEYRSHTGLPLRDTTPQRNRTYDDGYPGETYVPPESDQNIQKGLFNQERLEWIVGSDSSKEIKENFILEYTLNKATSIGETYGIGMGFLTGTITGILSAGYFVEKFEIQKMFQDPYTPLDNLIGAIGLSLGSFVIMGNACVLSCYGIGKYIGKRHLFKHLLKKNKKDPTKTLQKIYKNAHKKN